MSHDGAPAGLRVRRLKAPQRAACAGASPAPLLSRALRALLLAALVAAASGRDKMHRGKHEAASRRDRRAALGETLEQATGGMCHYLEAAPFVDYFNTPLNISRWDGRSMDGLFHCHRGPIFLHVAGFVRF